MPTVPIPSKPTWRVSGKEEVTAIDVMVFIRFFELKRLAAQAEIADSAIAV
jgi:hypothetical protein